MGGKEYKVNKRLVAKKEIEKKSIKLYHGSNKALSEWQLDIGSYLIDNYKLAEMFANHKVEEEGGKSFVSEFDLSPEEVEFDSKYPEGTAPLYSYEAKWILDTKENEFDVFDCPANITKELEEKINKVCLDTYRVLKCRDWSRIDLRLDKNGEPNIIEINPLPGIIPDPNENSSFPKAARAAGIDYNDMINTVLASAVKRYNLL